VVRRAAVVAAHSVDVGKCIFAVMKKPIRVCRYGDGKCRVAA